jgi:hypothetical protein
MEAVGRRFTDLGPAKLMLQNVGNIKPQRNYRGSNNEQTPTNRHGSNIFHISINRKYQR